MVFCSCKRGLNPLEQIQPSTMHFLGLKALVISTKSLHPHTKRRTTVFITQ